MIVGKRAAAVGAFFLFALLSQCAARESRVHANEARDEARVAASTEKPPNDPVLEKMSAMRELSIVRGVDRVTLSRDALLEKVRAHVERAVPHAEIEREDAFLKGMSAISRTDDYERSVYESLRSALGGMYEPFDGRMYLLEAARDEGATLAHESVHALQDQHFDLSAWEKYLPGASDEMLARACLAEGDAAVAAEETPAMGNASSYVEKEIVTPYVVGAAFVRALHANGGWATVSRAWEHENREGGLTTEQILHPEKWFGSERAEKIPAPPIATLGAEYRASSDVQGELSVSLVLGEYFLAKDAARFAAGWAGDASTVARAGDRAAVAWRIRWDDQTGAARAMDALARGKDDRCDAGFGLPMLLARRDRDVLILSGPPGSDCALLGRWAKEIFRE